MNRRIAVACSGGRDSLALLHATARAALGLGIEVHALHVHHGLMPEADGWLKGLRLQCRRWAADGLPLKFRATRIDAKPPAGASIEAWAREQRYAALVAMARANQIDLVLLAHHRRDQAETLLLQALRGAGLNGLAGMAARIERDGIVFARPWLGQGRVAIDAYVDRYRIDAVDDPSNADPRFLRSRLRREVWPAFAGAFEQAEAALAQSAARLREVQDALEEWRANDLRACDNGAAGLVIGELAKLSPARRSQALRTWLHRQAARSAPESLVRRLLDESHRGKRPAHWPWPEAGGAVQRWRGDLLWRVPGDADATRPPTLVSDLSQPGQVDAPAWHGHFCIRRGRGLPAALLVEAELRQRPPAASFQAGPKRPARSLKKQFQQAGVPLWARSAPLVYLQGRLAYVPGLGFDARWTLVEADAGGLQIEWVPDEP